MTKYGWDASDYDWARGPMDIAAARKAGIELFTHKISEGTGFRAIHAGEALHRANAAKIPVLGGYHVLHPRDMETVAAQIKWYLASLDAAFPAWRTHPCFVHQIDAEKFDYMTRRPSLAEIHEFGNGVIKQTGCAETQVVAYAPEWLYGDNLRGLKFQLWASGYVSGSGPFKGLYPGDKDSRWAPYSGITPIVLQYSSSSTIGTQHTCDANAIRVRSTADLVKLFKGAPAPTDPDVPEPVLDLGDNMIIVRVAKDSVPAGTKAPAGAFLFNGHDITLIAAKQGDTDNVKNLLEALGQAKAAVVTYKQFERLHAKK